MKQTSWPNLVAMFFDRAERHGDKPFLWAKTDGAYQPLSWRETARRASLLARGLKALGVGPGDSVVLVSENRPEWLIADIAVMAAGAITVPAYITNTVDDHRHIVEDSGAKAAMVSTRKLAERFLPAAHQSSAMEFVVTMEPEDVSQSLSVDVLRWDHVLETGATAPDTVAADAGRWRRDDTACIIYTSGTGGVPKGVMLHHGAILHNCAGAADALAELGLGGDVFLNFLPLSHSYEHTAGLFFPVSVDAQIYFAENVESLAANMAEARPTIMTAVPRLYETMRTRILRGVEKAGGHKEKMFKKTLELGLRKIEAPGSLSFPDRILDAALDRLVRDKVRRRFGGRLKALVSGGAPLNPDLGNFFAALGLCILQGYGQTESAPVISVNRPRKIKMHTVGPPLLHTEVKIAADGEILVRGELVMQGYWRNPAATADAIREGWLHTGDVGFFDEDGYIQITDRKKDIIVNSGGDNLSPQRIEGLLTLEPEIAQAMVHGDRRPHIVGLLVPDGEWLKGWAAAAEKPDRLEAVAGDADLHKALAAAVERVNSKISPIERVRHFIVADTAFTIDNAQMTPTLKVRRHKIREIYGERLERLYR